jgi:hypothetical protein
MESNTQSLAIMKTSNEPQSASSDIDSNNLSEHEMSTGTSIPSNVNGESMYRSLEMMADLISEVPLPAITVEHINKNAEIIESGLVPIDCKPKPDYDKCESVFPRLPEEENLLWREEMRKRLTYLISEYSQVKGIELLGIACNHLACEILVSFNTNMGDMNVEPSRLYAHLLNNQSLGIVDLDFGITPHGNPSDKFKDVYYQYYFLVFESDR